MTLPPLPPRPTPAGDHHKPLPPIFPPLPLLPQVTTTDFSRMEPITGIETVQRERWELTCCVCRQGMGAKIQCGSCYTAFHPLCGRYGRGGRGGVQERGGKGRRVSVVVRE